MVLGGINFPVFEEMLLVKKTFYEPVAKPIFNRITHSLKYGTIKKL